MEQSQENRAVEVEDLENELLSFDYKTSRANEALEKARQHYEQSRSELQQAQADRQAKKNSDTERQLRKAKHAFDMAERGVDSRKRRIEIIQSSYQELKSELDGAKAAIAQGDKRIAEQKRKVEAMVNAMLAKADAAQRAARMKKAAPVSKPKVPTATVASASKAAATPAPAPQQKPAREIDPDLLDYVKRERARLDKLLADGDEGKHTFHSLELDPSSGDRVPFKFLGHNQYRLVAPVEEGRQTYKINTWKFRRTIPADDDGVRYVFIFDGRRLSRPRLVMYPEYVLSQLDK
ncbi:hypothetical protein [Microbulbifer sp. SAOS-129_SWC]|uniref:hypothetical protein n=1 Tax=Microbulbifer sp. SAOS-129_SWC TaxID=3145235 RepID=UPI003216ABA1